MTHENGLATFNDVTALVVNIKHVTQSNWRKQKQKKKFNCLLPLWHLRGSLNQNIFLKRKKQKRPILFLCSFEEEEKNKNHRKKELNTRWTCRIFTVIPPEDAFVWAINFIVCLPRASTPAPPSSLTQTDHLATNAYYFLIWTPPAMPSK